MGGSRVRTMLEEGRISPNAVYCAEWTRGLIGAAWEVTGSLDDKCIIQFILGAYDV